MAWSLVVLLAAVPAAFAQFRAAPSSIPTIEAPVSPARTDFPETQTAVRDYQIPADISVGRFETATISAGNQAPLASAPVALPASPIPAAVSQWEPERTVAGRTTEEHPSAREADQPASLDPEELLTRLGEPEHPALASLVSALKTALKRNQRLSISIEGLEPGVDAQTEVSVEGGRRSAAISLSRKTWAAFKEGRPEAMDKMKEELVHAAQRVLDSGAMGLAEYSARRAFFELTAQAARKGREEKVALGSALRRIKGLIDSGDYAGALRAAGLSRLQEARFHADYQRRWTQVNYSSVQEDEPLARAHEEAAFAVLETDLPLAEELDQAGRMLDAVAAGVRDLIQKLLVAKVNHGQLSQLTAKVRKLLTLDDPAVRKKSSGKLITDKWQIISRLEFLRKLAELNGHMTNMGQAEAEAWARAVGTLIDHAREPMAADIVDVALTGSQGKKAADIRHYVELRLAYELEPDPKLKRLATDLAEALRPGNPASPGGAYAKGLSAGQILDLIHGYAALDPLGDKDARTERVSGFAIHLAILAHAPGVDGAGRLFDEAYEDLHKARRGEQVTLEGYFSEAELNIRLMGLPNWNLRRISLRHLPDAAGVDHPIKVRGVDRQIDAIAEHNSETVFIEYKATLDALLHKKNGQIEALIELARAHGAVPGIMVAGLERHADGTLRIRSDQRVGVMLKILEWEREFPGVPQPRIYDRAGNDLTEYFMLDASWDVREVATDADLVAVHAGRTFYIHFPGFFDDFKEMRQQAERLMDFAKERGIVPALLLEGAALVGGRLELRHGRQDVHELIKQLGQTRRARYGYPPLTILDVHGNDITTHF